MAYSEEGNPQRRSGAYGFGAEAPVTVSDVFKYELDPKSLFNKIRSLYQAISTLNPNSPAYKIKTDVNLRPEVDDERIACFDRLVKPNEYAVPVQDQNCFFDELEDITVLFQQLHSTLEKETFLENLEAFKSNNLFQQSVKMLLLGFYYEYVEKDVKLAFIHYKTAADAGYLDAVYYYIHHLLRTRHDLKKEDIATRKALYYCEKLNDRLHDGADFLMQEIRHRNWERETINFRPPSFDFLPMLLSDSLALQIQASFALLKPTKVKVGATQLPEEFQKVISMLRGNLSSEDDPILPLITAELWQLCYTKPSTLDGEPLPQRFCIGQAAHAYRAAIFSCRKKNHAPIAAWAFLELQKLVEYCLNPSIKSIEITWKNLKQQDLRRTRYYTSGVHYNPNELALCRYYHSTALFVLNLRHEVKAETGESIRIIYLIREDMQRFGLIWLMALQQERKEKSTRMTTASESDKSPLDMPI